MASQTSRTIDLETTLQIIIRMVTSSISIISSLLMIFAIHRSSDRLSTTQNRLLTGLAISDIISSTTIFLVTIPAPKDTPDVWLAPGNEATCTVQGFSFFFGGYNAWCYNAGLCIFFFLKIRYNMTDERVRVKVEPFLHAVPIITSLALGVIFILTGQCGLGRDMCSCLRTGGDRISMYAFYFTAFVLFLLVPLSIFTTMINIYLITRKQEIQNQRFGRGSLMLGDEEETTDERSLGNAPARPRQSRALVAVRNRGIAYSLAWFGSFIRPFLLFLGANSLVFAILSCIFFPLQGFYNFVIFMYPRVNKIRREGDYSLSRAIGRAIYNSPQST